MKTGAQESVRCTSDANLSREAQSGGETRGGSEGARGGSYATPNNARHSLVQALKCETAKICFAPSDAVEMKKVNFSRARVGPAACMDTGSIPGGGELQPGGHEVY